jgi:hypothetical protein
MDRSRKLFRLAGIVLVLTAVLFSFHCTRCSTKQERDTGDFTPVKKPVSSPEPVIAEVKLDPPQPTSADFIRAMPVLEDTGMTHVKYTYHWYVNGRRVPGNNKRLLARQSYKKGDKVYCRVTASRGIHEAKPLNSKRVTIQNAKPFLKLSAVTPFKIPGRFRYTLDAEDPDGDPLTYRLVAPLGLGITLDPETGEMTWDIPEIPKNEPVVSRTQTGGSADEEAGSRENPERKPGAKQPETAGPRLSPIVRLIFEVTDPDGAAARGSIDLHLSKEGLGKEIPR